VLNGPEMHRWHHADQPEAYDTNFATKLAIWDWMFGTAYLPDPRRRKAERFGLSEPGFPEGTPLAYLQQQAHAFRPFAHEADTDPASAAAGDAERAAGL